jgi:glycine hydroxymethyltransferase
MHTIAAKAVAFKEASAPAFKIYARQVIANARALARALEALGLSIVSGGTDSHLLLVDLRSSQANGKEAQALLDQVGITSNKNTIPFDPQPPSICSGIRLGTPALTTRGMCEGEMQQVAELIAETLKSRGESSVLEAIRNRVVLLSKRFPLYRHRLES